MPILRSFLIALSQNRVLQSAITLVPITRRMARRFVAGETLADALEVVGQLEAQGLSTTLDHLGENVTSQAEALASADEYLAALDALAAAGLGGHVSVKLTHMGLDLGDEFCCDNVSRIVRHAAERGSFVRIDMEGSPYTQRTLAIYRRLAGQFDNVGVVIQAYLKRSQADVEEMIAEGIGRFRLCKGAYDEPAEIAFDTRPRVTQALQELAQTALASDSRARGAYAAIASHDEAVTDFVRAYAYHHEIPPTAFEFQMLYGIRRELQTRLVRQGYRVRVYVPYGTHWYPYFMRRLAERPANLLFFLRAFVGN